MDRVGWVSVASAVGAVVAVGSAAYWTTSYLRSNHEQTQRLRSARKKYRELLSDLHECKGLLGYIDAESMPRAKALAKEIASLQKQQQPIDGGNDAIDDPKLEQRRRELLGIGEHILRLMERIDGVAPAQIVDAAGLEPWTEHDEALKAAAVRKGLGPVLDLAGDVRAIRRSLSHKAERRAKHIDALKKSIV
ncbi:hypothetical protein GGF46_003480 [Coemansia sp. RSA 552]|nr:hypothetical protein GGF46_003480 [Coemansia sp. RSA 552]